jgi:hypothetical protein
MSLIVGTDAGDDPQTQVAAEINGGEADSAGSSGDEDSFAGLRSRALDQGIVCVP